MSELCNSKFFILTSLLPGLLLCAGLALADPDPGELARAAQQGDAGAQFLLGSRYDHGQGVTEDDAEAVRWYRLAAEQGHASAQYYLGYKFAQGEGVARNSGEAVRWLRKAAGQDHAAAQYRLGAMYFNDEEAPLDKAEAARWFRAAAEQGHAIAQYYLGYMFSIGDGLPRDDAEAIHWYRLAAERGHTGAQERLREYQNTNNPDRLLAGELPDKAAAATGPVSVAEALAAQVQICRTPDPAVPSSAFTLAKSTPDENGDYFVNYGCKQACADWRECLVPAYKDDGMELLTQGRNPDEPKLALAYVVDDMAGHLALTPDGDKTVLLHSGAGGTDYRYAEYVPELERQAPVRSVMVRWEKGFTAPDFDPPFRGRINWGWYSRTGDEATNVYELNKRVAAIIAWVHENLAGDGAFATAGCSMGSNATFLPRLWHGLDPIIDYQLLVGGPNNWDFNAHCSRRQYTRGHCDADGASVCSTDNDCAALAPGGKCRMPGSYAHFGVTYEIFANHVHKTDACDYSLEGELEPYPPFDDSSMAFRPEADWEPDHRIDLVANINRSMEDPRGGGDEYFSLGEFTYAFTRLKPEENKQWHVLPETGHCEAWSSGYAIDLLVKRLGKL